MPNFNKVILMGMVTRTPELRQVSSGTSVTDVNILTKRSWLGPQGEERTSNDWVDATFWGRQAENVCKFFGEGKPIFVEGRLTYSSWETPEGQKRNKVQITADGFEFISPPSDQPGGNGDNVPYFNKVFLMGNMTRDPELRYIKEDRAVLDIGLATKRIWTDNSGQKREDTDFIDVSFWGKPAEEISRLYRKGAPLFVEGHLTLDSWDDRQTGEKRRKLKVTGENFRLHESFGEGGGNNGGGGQEPVREEPGGGPPAAHTEYDYSGGGPSEGQGQENRETEDEDVPF